MAASAEGPSCAASTLSPGAWRARSRNTRRWSTINPDVAKATSAGFPWPSSAAWSHSGRSSLDETCDMSRPRVSRNSTEQQLVLFGFQAPEAARQILLEILTGEVERDVMLGEVAVLPAQKDWLIRRNMRAQIQHDLPHVVFVETIRVVDD